MFKSSLNPYWTELNHQENVSFILSYLFPAYLHLSIYLTHVVFHVANLSACSLKFSESQSIRQFCAFQQSCRHLWYYYTCEHNITPNFVEVKLTFHYAESLFENRRTLSDLTFLCFFFFLFFEIRDLALLNWPKPLPVFWQII